MIARFLLGLGALLLGGCLTIPHLDPLSPRITGRVIDAATGAPLSDARVELIEYPSMAVLTDANGDFVVPETRKPELFVPITGPKEPYNIGARVAPRLRITLAGYEPREIDAAESQYWVPPQENDPRIGSTLTKGPFLLRPIELKQAASVAVGETGAR